MEIAIVEWADVQIAKDESNGSNWMSKEDFESWCAEGIIICKSVGWLTFESDDFIVISQTELNGDVAESTKIPHTSIIKLSIVLHRDKNDIRTPTLDKHTYI